MRIDELRAIAQAGKHTDPALYRMHRHVSIHFTRVALWLGMDAHQVSLLMIVCGWAGAVAIVSSARWVALTGLGLLYLGFVLDKVDGEVARLRGTESAEGVFLDRLYHRLVEPSVFVGVALHEFRHTGSPAVLVAGFATVLLGNAIDENQHLAAYIFLKRLREGGRPPRGPAAPRSRALARVAWLLRPLKGFRMLIVTLPLMLLYYVIEWQTRLPVPTYGLYVSTTALGVYLLFQCFYYFREQLAAESHAITRLLNERDEAAAAAAEEGLAPEVSYGPAAVRAAARSLIQEGR